MLEMRCGDLLHFKWITGRESYSVYYHHESSSRPYSFYTTPVDSNSTSFGKVTHLSMLLHATCVVGRRRPT